jgi:hypothetical protein
LDSLRASKKFVAHGLAVWNQILAPVGEKEQFVLECD